MKSLLSILLVGMLAGARCNSQAKGQEQSWIDRLKNTPVARMETGLPEKPFGQWFTEQTKAARPKYEMGACDTEGGTSGTQCIIVSAQIAPVRKVELTFAIPQDKAAKTGSAVVCTFIRGAIGPSDPRSKQPTRLIRKLSEIETILR